ncbi:hypothetical protein CVT26_009396 [Gymnopilus dilepis]|uniref:Uncharacterized protein n=1 Tax=Gymnopilus dilepis TaxID=231916 RepID=A0A409YIJ0_9AGAR|nr:hypothetical protein CVT26_009396 [Gymnopilus dilepis]
MRVLLAVRYISVRFRILIHFEPRNPEKERERSRRRAQCLREIKDSLPEEIIETQKKCHREAQARYRERHRLKLKSDTWQYRLKKRRERGLAHDEEEYQRLMAQTLDAS